MSAKLNLFTSTATKKQSDGTQKPFTEKINYYSFFIFIFFLFYCVINYGRSQWQPLLPLNNQFECLFGSPEVQILWGQSLPLVQVLKLIHLLCLHHCHRVQETTGLAFCCIRQGQSEAFMA